MLSAIHNLRCFVRDPLLFMNNQHKIHGDFFSVYLGHKRFHFARHPVLAEHVLATHVSDYRKSRLIFDKIKPITGDDGLVQLEGSAWQDMRDITSEMFHKQHLDRYLVIINQYAEKLIDDLMQEIQRGAVVDIAAVMTRYTINIAVRLFFGFTSDKHARMIADNFIELNYLCGLRMRQIISLPLKVPTALNNKIRCARARIEACIEQLMAAKDDSHDDCLLSRLGVKLPANQHGMRLIKDQMMTFMFAGYETTAASLSFCLYLLASHQDAQQQASEEAQAGKTEYINAVYREALRLYPPAYMLAREALHEHQLADAKVKKGDNLILSLFELHRHPAFWQDSHQFIPARFLQPSHGETSRFAFFPFGYGKRVCSGMQLAMMEAAVILQALITHFKFKLPENSELKLEAMVTLHPQGRLDLLIERLT